jgi:hypothetical protein
MNRRIMPSQFHNPAVILALRIGHEPAHVHFIEHALAQRADRLLAEGSCLEVGVLEPLDPQERAPASHLRSFS